MIVAAIVAAVTIVLCYGGYLFLQLPIMGSNPVPSPSTLSPSEEETDRLVVNLSTTYGGLSTIPSLTRKAPSWF